MRLALAEAEAALGVGEVPVGCVFIDNRTGDVVVAGHNETNATINATRHAGEANGNHLSIHFP